MKQIKSMLAAIVPINSINKTTTVNKTSNKLFSFPGNIDIFDSAQVSKTSNIKTIIENNLLKNLTNSNFVEINSLVSDKT